MFVCPLVLEEVHKKLTLPLRRGFLDHLLRQLMGLDGLIEAKFSSTVAAPHRVPSSSAHCSIKGSFRGRASCTCTYAEHTLMRDETRHLKLRGRGRAEGRRGRRGRNKTIIIIIRKNRMELGPLPNSAFPSSKEGRLMK